MRCILHKWTKWSDQFDISYFSALKVLLQSRRCERCGIIETRAYDEQNK